VARFARDVIVLGTLLACSATPISGVRVTTRDFASGTRLLARGWDADGALVLRDFFDVERNEPCGFMEDGQWRIGPGPSYWCLPLQAAKHDAATGPFADADCKTPLAAAPVDGAATYAIVRPKNACGTAPRVHRVGESKRALARFLQDGVCVAGDRPVLSYALGEEVPLDAFVRATEQALPPSDADTSARIASLMLVASDGAKMSLGGFDRERNEPGRVENPSGAAARWVPLRVAFAGGGEVLFGDAACTSPLATKLAYDAACPLSAMVAFEGPCAAVTYHALGPRVEAQPVYRADDKTCTASTAEKAGVIAYQTGAPIDPSAFAPATEKDSGGAKVKRRGYAGPGGGAAAFSSELVDAQTSEPCEPALAEGGVLRCLPTAVVDVSMFADSACTTPAFVSVSTPGCEKPQASYVRSGGETGARVYKVTGEVPHAYQRRGQACVEASSSAGQRAFAASEIDLARFAPVEERERL
jgi:hypothetical protein